MTHRDPQLRDPSPPRRDRVGHDIDDDHDHDDPTLFDQIDAEPFKTHTDLPLTQSVNGGNHAGGRAAADADPWMLLDEAARHLADPPLDLVDTEAVLAWVDRAGQGLTVRQDRRRLARAAMRVLERDFQTAMNVGRLREQLERQEADQRARQAGTYWAERDKRRRAQQPTHVEVDRDAWRAMRVVATRRGRSLGEEVGRLVVAEVAHPRERSLAHDRPESEACGRRAHVFARLVVAKPTWQDFRALGAVRHSTVARYVGLLVEECVAVSE